MAGRSRKSYLDRISEISVQIANLEKAREEKAESFNKKIAELRKQQDELITAHKAEQMDQIAELLDKSGKTQVELLEMLRKEIKG